jgi:hypothetical protein
MGIKYQEDDRRDAASSSFAAVSADSSDFVCGVSVRCVSVCGVSVCGVSDCPDEGSSSLRTSARNSRRLVPGSLTLAIKEKRCEASKMAYFFVNFSIFFLSNV